MLTEPASRLVVRAGPGRSQHNWPRKHRGRGWQMRPSVGTISRYYEVRSQRPPGVKPRIHPQHCVLAWQGAPRP